MLEAFLDQLSISNLKLIARNHGLTSESESEIARDLRAKLLDASYLKHCYEKLSEFEKFVLHEFIFSIGSELFTSRQLEQWQGKISNSEFRIGLTKLRQKGFIFTLRRMWGEVAYIFPEDIFRLWSGVLLSVQNRVTAVTEEKKLHVSVSHSRLPGIDQDLFHLLAMIAKTEIPLTQKGAIYKRHVLKISEGFVDRSRNMVSTSEENQGEPQLVDQRAYDPEIYTSRFAFVVQLAERLGLLTRQDGFILVDTSEVQKWLKLSSGMMMDIVYDTWKHVRPSFKHQWLYFVQTMMEEDTQFQWQTIASLVTPLEDVVTTKSDENKADIIKKWLLKPLHYLGYIELGTDEHVGEMWRWVPLHHEIEPEKFYIQPNFEVLVPPHFSMASRWLLSQMATLLSSDQMVMYQITEDSYTGAIELGYSNEELLLYLNSHCAVPLPPNVEMSLRQWGTSYGRVKFLDVLVMECADERLVDELLVQPKLSQSIIQRISPTHLLVYKEEVQELRTWLERHGYSPLKRVVTMDRNHTLLKMSDMEAEGSPSGDAFHFLMHQDKSDGEKHWSGLSPLELHGYRVENVYPEMEEAVPGLKQVPKMWLDQYRNYHKSTLRDLLLKAIDLKLKVKMSIEHHEYTDLLPTVMRNVGGAWWLETVKDSETMSVNIDTIEKIQLSKPDIET